MTASALSTREARAAYLGAAMRENVEHPGALLQATELVAIACGRSCFVAPEETGCEPFPTFLEIFSAAESERPA
ncbi:hypothetical protein VSR82_21770 [Burkholderia sp. JPY481]